MPPCRGSLNFGRAWVCLLVVCSDLVPTNYPYMGTVTSTSVDDGSCERSACSDTDANCSTSKKRSPPHRSVRMSHVTFGPVDRNRLRLNHRNPISHSHVLGRDGLNKFIATVTTSDFLSSKRHGISEKLAKNAELVKESGTVVDGIKETDWNSSRVGSIESKSA